VGPRAGLDAVLKRKIPTSLVGLEPPVVQLVAQRYTTELTLLLTHGHNDLISPFFLTNLGSYIKKYFPEEI
jgi:hypothetical protein